jgi:hypothetical protein
MKRHLLAIVLASICHSAGASVSAAEPVIRQKMAEQVAGADTLVVVASLAEIPGTFPSNDLYNYVFIMKYRVVNVIKGTYDGREILVGEYNPRIARALVKDKMDNFVDGNVTQFEVGATHRLTLITPIGRVWKKAIENEYADSDLPQYYALITDVAP